MSKLINIFFLKKKRYIQGNFKKQNSFLFEIKAGTILFFEYISLDRDLFFKYKIYGLCVGRSKNLTMSICYLHSNIVNNYISFTFYLFSPFIYNIKILSNFSYNK